MTDKEMQEAFLKKNKITIVNDYKLDESLFASRSKNTSIENNPQRIKEVDSQGCVRKNIKLDNDAFNTLSKYDLKEEKDELVGKVIFSGAGKETIFIIRKHSRLNCKYYCSDGKWRLRWNLKIILDNKKAQSK